MRRVKKGPGRRPQSAKRQRFMELRARGWPIAAAGREVGVSRTTAGNWAHGYKVYRRGQVVGFVDPLDRLAVKAISARYLSQEERVLIADLPRSLLRSITWDQGTEMARHLTIAADLDARVYFCDPHSPWQRGTNENTNGLLRQYFPKGTDLSVHAPDHLRDVEDEINRRPRLVLNDATPAALFEALIASPNHSPLRR